MNTEERDRQTMRVQSEFKEEIMRAAAEDGQSANEFLKAAVRFYLDSRTLDRIALLPRSITAAIDGRLGLFEDRIASMLFTNSVTIDEMAEVFAMAYKISEDTMRHVRAQSVSNVKQTKGRVSFDQKVRDIQQEN